MDSVFTKIIKKEISSYTVYEDSDVIAFLDINPIKMGHTLVVPKKQIDYIFDLDNDDYNKLWTTTKMIANGLRKSVVCRRVGISVVGFEVPHCHIHLIPINTISDMSFDNIYDYTSSEMTDIAERIRKNIKN
jgi:histidine triad (HIT) family protein